MEKLFYIKLEDSNGFYIVKAETKEEATILVFNREYEHNDDIESFKKSSWIEVVEFDDNNMALLGAG